MVYDIYIKEILCKISFVFILADRHKHRRRKYQHRFNKCLTELIEKYPPIPAHDDLVSLINIFCIINFIFILVERK